MSKQHFFVSILSIVIIFSGCQVDKPENLKIFDQATNTETSVEWKEVEPGLSYSGLHIKNTYDDEFKDLFIIKIDPAQYHFSLYQNQKAEEAKTIEEIYNETNALLAFNGQFFTEDFKPTGLLIAEGETIRDISTAELLNGIIAINQNREPQFLTTPRAINQEDFIFAIQNGPVLLDENGDPAISQDSGKTASRTALGLDRNNNIMLIVLKQSLLNFENSISLYQFAHILSEHPELQKLGLHSMLNLDGGSSTGLMIDNKYYPEMEKVQNVVLVKRG